MTKGAKPWRTSRSRGQADGRFPRKQLQGAFHRECKAPSLEKERSHPPGVTIRRNRTSTVAACQRHNNHQPNKKKKKTTNNHKTPNKETRDGRETGWGACLNQVQQGGRSGSAPGTASEGRS